MTLNLRPAAPSNIRHVTVSWETRPSVPGMFVVMENWNGRITEFGPMIAAQVPDLLAERRTIAEDTIDAVRATLDADVTYWVRDVLPCRYVVRR